MVLHWCGTDLMYQAILALKVITITVVSSQVPSLLSWWGVEVCLSVCHAIGRVRVGRVTAVRRTSPLLHCSQFFRNFEIKIKQGKLKPANTSKQANRCQRERRERERQAKRENDRLYTLSHTHKKIRNKRNHITHLHKRPLLY